MLPLWLCALLGAVQGLTEFLPVSSSGHLVLLQSFFSDMLQVKSLMFFDLMLHLGTVLAVIIAFRKDVYALIKAFFGMAADRFRIRNIPERRFIVMILISMLPLVFVLPFTDRIDALFSSPFVVGPALLLTACLLILSDKAKGGRLNEKDASNKNALYVGIMQLIAVIPGVSRSGATISGGILNGFSKDFAVRFSFIMSLPVIVGANILSLPEALKEAGGAGNLPAYLVGVVSACVFGLIAIKTVRLLVGKKGLWPFAVYCVLLGSGIIISSLI